MDYVASLSELAVRFIPVASPDVSPLEREITLQPPADAVANNRLVLLEMTQVTQFVPGPATTYNVDYLFRNVRFASPTDDTIIGGMPVVEALTALPGTGVMYSAPDKGGTPGVPGVVGKLTTVVTTQVEKLVDKLSSRRTARPPRAWSTTW